jgi:hypothetical protein
MGLVDAYESLSLRTDKGHGHKYLSYYGTLLDSLQHKPVTFCEIGVQQGASMLLWDTFFTHPNAKIYGIDLHLFSVMKEIKDQLSSRVNLIEKDVLLLENSSLKDMKFDVALDDGGHTPHLQIAFFEFFQPRLNPNALLFIEDVQNEQIVDTLLALHERNKLVDLRGPNLPPDNRIISYKEPAETL